MRTLLALALAAIPLAACSRGSDDADVKVVGTGLPADWRGRADDSSSVADVSWTPDGSGARVVTGPAFIAWRVADTARGTYRIEATMRQLAPYKHFEASGIFLGGSDLEGPAQRYLYFLVRGDGLFLVKVREGSSTRDVVPWTASPAVAKLDAAGTATWPLAVQVTPDTIRFFVGDQPVTAIAAAGLPSAGQVGVRVNHNLQARVEGPVIRR